MSDKIRGYKVETCSSVELTDEAGTEWATLESDGECLTLWFRFGDSIKPFKSIPISRDEARQLAIVLGVYGNLGFFPKDSFD